MEPNSIKQGDYVSWKWYDETGFGYFVGGNIVERIDKQGWYRDVTIPDGYVSRASDTYFSVDVVEKAEQYKFPDFTSLPGMQITYTNCGIDYAQVPYFSADALEPAEIIKSNNITNSNLYKDMNLIDKIRVNIKGEPMKTLIKNEVLTINETLTNTGKELFTDFLYAKFKDEFVADLAPKLEGLNNDSK